MSKPTNYQLLKDVHEALNRLEDKQDIRIALLESRIEENESKIDTMWGKASIGVLVLSVTIGTAVNLVIDWIKGK